MTWYSIVLFGLAFLSLIAVYLIVSLTYGQTFRKCWYVFLVPIGLMIVGYLLA